MKIALWIVQGLLAVAFLMAGSMKMMTAYDELAVQMAWVGRWSEQMVMLIGLVEVLGALGLILPSVLRIQPKLTPIAAMGLVLVMGLAIIDHLRAGETVDAFAPLILMAMALFVAWGRWSKHPIQPK
ncbi:MAG: DoxX family protein [Flavobacteriales bacterium]|nr:DoxX family protein [Flavobacteriales bacterium]